MFSLSVVYHVFIPLHHGGCGINANSSRGVYFFIIVGGWTQTGVTRASLNAAKHLPSVGQQ